MTDANITKIVTSATPNTLPQAPVATVTPAVPVVVPTSTPQTVVQQNVSEPEKTKNCELLMKNKIENDSVDLQSFLDGEEIISETKPETKSEAKSETKPEAKSEEKEKKAEKILDKADKIKNMIKKSTKKLVGQTRIDDLPCVQTVKRIENSPGKKPQPKKTETPKKPEEKKPDESAITKEVLCLTDEQLEVVSTKKGRSNKEIFATAESNVDTSILSNVGDLETGKNPAVENNDKKKPKKDDEQEKKSKKKKKKEKEAEKDAEKSAEKDAEKSKKKKKKKADKDDKDDDKTDKTEKKSKRKKHKDADKDKDSDKSDKDGEKSSKKARKKKKESEKDGEDKNKKTYVVRKDRLACIGEFYTKAVNLQPITKKLVWIHALMTKKSIPDRIAILLEYGTPGDAKQSTPGEKYKLRPLTEEMWKSLQKIKDQFPMLEFTIMLPESKQTCVIRFNIFRAGITYAERCVRSENFDTKNCADFKIISSNYWPADQNPPKTAEIAEQNLPQEIQPAVVQKPEETKPKEKHKEKSKEKPKEKAAKRKKDSDEEVSEKTASSSDEEKPKKKKKKRSVSDEVKESMKKHVGKVSVQAPKSEAMTKFFSGFENYMISMSNCTQNMAEMLRALKKEF